MKKRMLCVVILCIFLSGCAKEQAAVPTGTGNPTATASPGSSAAPAAGDQAADTFVYEEPGTDSFGFLGEIKLYNYYLASTYRAVVDEFVKRQHDYDSDWSVTEFNSFAKNLLLETDSITGRNIREQLQEEALQECMRMLVMHAEATANGLHLSEKNIKNITDRWKNYGIQYYSKLKDSVDFITGPDAAMRWMAGCNVMESVEYMKIHALASDYASRWFYRDTSDNRDFAQYYQEHRDAFRIVTVRAVYVKEESQAETVRKLMNQRPEHIANLARALNEDPRLAETKGIVEVTSDTYMVPEEVKRWAYSQTEESLFSKHGKIETVKTADGIYLLMCEGIQEYGEDEDNEVYQAVGQACKAERLDEYLDGLLAQESYELKDFDRTNAVRIMDESMPE